MDKKIILLFPAITAFCFLTFNICSIKAMSAPEHLTIENSIPDLLNHPALKPFAIHALPRPETLAEFEREYPKTAFIAQLDVTNDGSVERAIKSGLDKFGQIDVLVNNAGYCLRGAVEECTLEEIRRQFDVNFYGSVRTIQKILPSMRKAGHGAIVNFSSIAALDTAAGSAFYGASKCAVEGMSSGVAKEVNPLGIKVIVIEPGSFKTDFFNRSIDINSNNIPAYSETAGKRKVKLANPEDFGIGGWGDNALAANAIIRAVEMPDSPFRLLLGSLAVKMGENFVKTRAAEIERCKDLSESTDART